MQKISFMVGLGMNKAQELIKWFKENGDAYTERYDIDLDWFDYDGYISDTFEIYDQGRWWVSEGAVWKFDDGSFAELTWRSPATEMQEGQPPMINIVEVEPYETTVIKYRAVKS